MYNRYRVNAKQPELAKKFGFDLAPEPERVPPPELFPKKPAGSSASRMGT
jgi:hypothetical protein